MERDAGIGDDTMSTLAEKKEKKGLKPRACRKCGKRLVSMSEVYVADGWVWCKSHWPKQESHG